MILKHNEKFKKTINQLENLEQKWLYFFKHAEGSTFAEIEHLIGSDVIIRRAFEAIDQAAWTEEELNTYDKITKTRLDNLAVEQQKIEDAEAPFIGSFKPQDNLNYLNLVMLI